jgi:hypothetical protein
VNIKMSLVFKKRQTEEIGETNRQRQIDKQSNRQTKLMDSLREKRERRTVNKSERGRERETDKRETESQREGK